MPEPQDEPRSNSDRPGESEPAISMRILDSIADGLVVLDRNWRYTYVNAHAAQIFGRPRPELLGRCVWDLFPFIVGTDMERQMRRAADEQVTCEFQGNDAAAERFYENRAFPTPDGGVAVYSRDITERRQHERLIESAREYAESIVTTVREPLLVLDNALRVVSANRSFYATFRVGPAETEGRAVYDLGDGQWDIPRLRTLLEEIVPANRWFDDFEVEHDFEHIGRKTMLLNARRFPPEGPFELILLAMEDITDRKRAEEKDHRSEALLVEAQRLAHIGSWNWDLTNGAFQWSDEHYRIFGFEPRDPPITLDRAWDRVHPKDRTRVQDLFDQAMRDRRPYDCIFRLILDDGAVRIVQSRGRPEVNEGGELVRMFGTIQDISDRKRAEEALRVANEQLDLAIRGSNIGVWDVDLAPGSDYRREPVRFINVWEQLGYDPAEFPTDAPASRALGQPDDLARVDDAVAACLAGETEEIRVENRTRHKDGSYHWLLTLGKAMRDASGRPVRLIGTVLDITDRKRAEEALRESEGRFRGTFESAAVGIAHKDVNGRFLRVNETYCAIVGYTREELLARTFHDITYPEDLAAELEQYTRLMRGELSSYSLEKRYVRKDGSLVWIDVTISLQRDAADRPAYAIAVLQDISERKRLEADLRRAKEAAEAANRSKDEFLANVSHEIRTPFGAILGMTELVLDTPLTDDQRQCLETVKSAADSLLGLVDDLLDFEKIEAGKLALVPAEFSLRPTMADALRALIVRAHLKGLELACDVEPDVPDALVGDAGRLRQVLLNLVGNAIKFTKQGEVAVRVEAVDVPAPGGDAVLRFAVRDTGIGIPLDGRERIFRAFEQADSSTTREYGGTGLGLTIAARLVGLMGGTITVESEPGRGSTFSFTARFGQQPPSPERVVARLSDVLHEAAPPAPAATPLCILVAEDNEFNVRHLQRLLGKQGHDVRLANNGREALTLLGIEGQGPKAEGPLTSDFDVLLLDLHMPELDGFQVVRAIRERERAAGGHLPVIALTARSRQEDRERGLAAGMDDYLSKPIRAAELFAAIDRAVSALGVPRARRPAGGDPAGLLDPVVLLATCGDDAGGLRELCRDFLAFAPARIAEVTDALRAGDAPRLREAAHKLRGLLSAFSTAAGDLASDLEELAGRGQLVEVPPLVGRLETMAQELVRQVDGLSLESLRRRAATAGS
jgi:PAS domain S-box-containing protein